MNLIESTRTWARRIKRDAVTLWVAKGHPRTPWVAKALGVFVVAYALSPIDLIPDFIPMLGYLDDVILLPALIYVTVRMIPPDVLAECRVQADQWIAEKAPGQRASLAGSFIASIWVMAVGSIY